MEQALTTPNQCGLAPTLDSDAHRLQAIDHEMTDLTIMSPFAVDTYIKLLPCKALRRLGDKTQVMTGSSNRHIRNRRVHTDDVVAVAAQLAYLLDVNPHLSIAIALGHDIGHVPMGHVGERWLAGKIGRDFHHEVMSVVVAQFVERDGNGLNLTHQTLEGILLHSRGSGTMTVTHNTPPEYAVAMYADKLAYTFGDYNDLFFPHRGGLNENDFPKLASTVKWFGVDQRERIRKCLRAIHQETLQLADGTVHFDHTDESKRFAEIRNLMYGIYGQFNFKDTDLLNRVYDRLSGFASLRGCNPALIFALMTDHDIISLAASPDPEDTFSHLELAELVPFLRQVGFTLDLTDPKLDW